MMVRIGEALLHSLWMGTVVAVGLWLALGVLRSSRARYGAAMVAMVFFVLFPLATLLPWDGASGLTTVSRGGRIEHHRGRIDGDRLEGLPAVDLGSGGAGLRGAGAGGMGGGRAVA